MKRLLVLSVLFMLSASISYAQLRKIPAGVTEAFAKKFPSAKMVSWKDNIINYEAAFVNGNDELISQFNAKGEWLETIKKVKFDELDEAIKDGFDKSKYNDWEVRGAVEITAKDKEIVYRILVKKNAFRKTYLFYNKRGQLQKNGPAI